MQYRKYGIVKKIDAENLIIYRRKRYYIVNPYQIITNIDIEDWAFYMEIKNSSIYGISVNAEYTIKRDMRDIIIDSTYILNAKIKKVLNDAELLTYLME
jgi:hypothetical protein